MDRAARADGGRVTEWIWLGLNAVVGLPLAALVLVIARETIRAAVAPALGFRVFALRWGAGPACFERAVGPVDLVLAPWPLAGATVARSGAPQRHRLGRILLALAPPLAQTLWLVGRMATGTPPGAAPLFRGPAPLACLDLANVLLLVGHATLAVELRGGVRTDVRLLLDALLGRADSDRGARANYYARLARHRLERADVAGARAATEQGLRQLGPESLLLACERRLEAVDLDSVVDQSACADALRREIEAAEPRRHRERAAWTLAERARQGAASALPLVAALLALAFVQADRFARHLETGMHAMGREAIDANDAEDCTRMIQAWSEWAARVDPWLPPPADARSERHLGLARLERCRGALDRAAEHHGEALLAAHAAATSTDPQRLTDPASWLADELRVTTLLRETARLASEQARHRDALRTLHQAEARLSRAERRLALFGSGGPARRARDQVSRERAAIDEARASTLARMRASP